MTIQDRLKRSNMMMLVVPVLVVGVLLVVALVTLLLMLELVYLELGGYAVTIAPDGTTGLDKALHQDFDLLLLDVMLPGISGSSILLIAGVYLPTIQAVHNLMALQLNVLPGLCALGFGVLAGVGFSISAIRAALQNHRSAMVWLILGLMVGSLYAIANGPASLDVPFPPLSLETVRLPAVAIGVVILLALEGLKKSMEKAA